MVDLLDQLFELLEGWRTTLTGMTAHESQALFLSGLPGPVEELGLGETMASAQLKLLAALPRDWQVAAHRVSSRFHVDLTGWYRRTRPVPELRTLADAVFADRRVTVEYESWEGVVTRELEPLGLIVKAGVWYLAAQPRGGRPGKAAAVRTYRATSIRALRVGGGFTRPKDFDLPAYWLESTRRFERDIYRGTADLRLSERGRCHLCGASTAVEEAIEKAVTAGRPDKDGWWRVTVPIESIAHARADAGAGHRGRGARPQRATRGRAHGCGAGGLPLPAPPAAQVAGHERGKRDRASPQLRQRAPRARQA